MSHWPQPSQVPFFGLSVRENCEDAQRPANYLATPKTLVVLQILRSRRRSESILVMVLRRAASAEEHFSTWSEKNRIRWPMQSRISRTTMGRTLMYIQKYEIDQYSSSKEHVCPDRHGCHASGRSWKTDSLSPYRPDASSEPWSSHTTSIMRVLINTRAHTWSSRRAPSQITCRDVWGRRPKERSDVTGRAIT